MFLGGLFLFHKIVCDIGLSRLRIMAGGLVYYIVLRIDVFLQFADVVKLVYTYA